MKENTFNAVLKEEKVKKAKRIYKYKEFQTEYILLYPLMVLVYWLDKLGHYLRNRTQWSDKRTERIITGEFRLKLIGFIKKSIIGLGSIGLGVGAAKVIAKGAVGVIMSPAKLGGLVIVAIGILVGVAIDKKVDAKHRRQILNDLKSELEIVNEKIEDAKSENDRKAKYELMRIRNKLIKDIERIEYNLN